MRLKIPGRLRYRTVNRLEFQRSWASRALFRAAMFFALIAAAAPWRVTRELTFGALDIKASARAMLWVWNRSWIPFKFPMGTFFDIGWTLSEKSCEALRRRGFVSKGALKRQCDLAQFKLFSIRAGIEAGDQEKIEGADREVVALVGRVFDAARDWASAAPEPPVAAKTTETSTEARNAHRSFDNAATKSALLDFDELCRAIGQRYFLVSGTFLGVVRDGAFIGHDHDIDLGVFEDALLDCLLPALEASARFSVTRVDHVHLRESGTAGVRYTRLDKPVLIRIVHATGTGIDVFVHFYDGDVVWHGTREQRWENRRFELRDFDFLGRKFKGAADFDRYLTENYGPDWRVPKSDFDSSIDTPNIGFMGTASGLVFWAWMVARAVAEGDVTRVNNYLDLLDKWASVPWTKRT